jgi:flagellar hook-associated protein FlgK
MSGISIGLSAIAAQQQALDVFGENIANADTPGFHRQSPQFTERPPLLRGNLQLGTGVDVASVQRLRSILIENSITTNTFESGNTTAQLDILNQVQTSLTPGQGSLDQLLSSFFDQLSQLSAQPDDSTQRQIFLDSATALTGKLNSISQDFSTLGENIDQTISQTVSQVNTLASQIADLNGQIQQVELRGINANDLRDQRDNLISQLAGLVDVRVVEQPSGVDTVTGGGAPLAVGTQAGSLSFSKDSSGNAIVTSTGSTTPLTLSGGKLAGLLQVRNEILPEISNRLEQFTRALVTSVDEIQATGLGSTGPSTLAVGTRAVSNANVLLSQANLAFPPTSGSLFISVTDQSTGNRTLNEVQINPATQSLADVAASISAISHIQAVVDPQTQTLRILAQPGFAFDFAGRIATAPTTSAITGTTTAQLGGNYTGTTNDTLTYQVVGTGTVGVTPNLTLQVKNSASAVIASLNIGQGYEPGSTLQVGNGITLQLSSGTANAGDQFTTRVVGQPDSAGILTALGLNSFFTGRDAGSVAVSSSLLNNPQQLAGSRTGQPGDASNFQRITNLQDALLLGNGTQTLGQFYAAMVGDVGTRVQSLNQQQSAQQLIGQNLQARQQAISGVDPNEELVHILESQRAFQMAAKYISTVNATVDQLLSIIAPTTATG